MENGSYLNRYIEELTDAGKMPGTLKQYTSDLTTFISWLDASIEKDLLRIDAADVTKYIEQLTKKKLSKTTIKRHMSVINQLLAHYDIDAELPAEHAETYRVTPLKPSDFISDKEMQRLLESMKRPIHSAARDLLIDRNLAIVHLIRTKGLRPKEISSINMTMINLAQSTIEFEMDVNRSLYNISGELKQYILMYLETIHPLKRPRYKSNDPLFVSFNNRSHDYQYDYANGQPKRLSTRGIQEMIKDEVRLAGLRKLSAKHLRNSCILEHISSGQDEKEIQRYFHLTHPFSLRRYKEYQKSADSREDG